MLQAAQKVYHKAIDPGKQTFMEAMGSTGAKIRSTQPSSDGLASLLRPS